MYEISLDWERLEQVSEFSIWAVLYESGKYVAECHRKVVKGRKVAGAISPLFMLEVCNLSVRRCYMIHYSCSSG